MGLAQILAPEAACAQPLTLTNLWSLRVGRPSDSSPAIGQDGTVYFGSFEGRLYAVNPNGELKWSFATGYGGQIAIEIHASPAVAPDGTIYFGCRDRRLYALTPAGRKKWDFSTGGWVDSSAAIGPDGTVYFGSWDKKFYAVSPAGQKQWEFETGGPIVSSPAIGTGGRIFFGSHDGKCYALNPDGTKAWEHSTGSQIITSPAIDSDGGVYLSSLDGFLYAFTADGALRWKLRTGGATESSPVLGLDGTIYLGVNKRICAISAEGKKLWDKAATADEFQQPIDASPVVLHDGSVIIISRYGLLTALKPDTKPAWAVYLHGYGAASPAVAADGTVYVYEHFPNVGYGLSAYRGTAGLAASPWPRFRAQSSNTGTVKAP